MFNLDIQIVKFIYDSCHTLGSCFGFGFFEGACMYSGLLVWGVLSGLSISKRGKK